MASFRFTKKVKQLPPKVLFLNIYIIMEIASDFSQCGPNILGEILLFLLK